MKDYILEAKGVTKHYAEHLALYDISLRIPTNSIYGLLGPNGAGKTTFIRIINQIIEADSGEIIIDGSPLNPDHIAIIGYLPEERGLYKKMSVGEQLVYLGQLRNMSRKDAIAQSKAWTKKLDIDDWWSRKVEDLSKGMAQKIQFIATVLNRPRLIILDEPFSGFDPVNANLIKDEILQLRDEGSTIIFSTHRMESVEQLCDHIAMINKSKMIMQGSKKDIKNQYRNNTYVVEHSTKLLNGQTGKFDILDSQEATDELTKTIIRIPEGVSPNELLGFLIKETEVHSFSEKIPSINEIFISTVKGESHE
jgi:ABC-2 type transport system ATP-binding protein